MLSTPWPRAALNGLALTSIPGAGIDDYVFSTHDAEDATDELSNLWRPQGKQVEDDYSCAQEFRPLSVLSTLSTRAGSTPGVDSASSPFRCNTTSPSPPGTPFILDQNCVELEACGATESVNVKAKSSKRTSKVETSKVFIGGIPQHWDCKALCNTFSQFGKVKNAWLQIPRQDRSGGSKPLNHRGFGFVVFSEQGCVDHLLGGNFSRLVCFGETQIEVKRAVPRASADLEKTGNVERQRQDQLSSKQMQTVLSTTQMRSHQSWATQWPNSGLSALPCYPPAHASIASEPPNAPIRSHQSLESPPLRSGLPILASCQDAANPCDVQRQPALMPHVSPSLNNNVAFFEHFTQNVFPGLRLEQTLGSDQELECLLLSAAPDSYDE